MNWKEAAKILMARIEAPDMAKAIGCSYPMIYITRISETAKAFPNPPKGWKAGVIKLGDNRAK